MSRYCQKQFLYIVQILYEYCLDIFIMLSKYCSYIVQILSKYCPNIVQILSKYCPNIVWILWKYCQNIEQISYHLISLINNTDTWTRKCLPYSQILCSHWAHMTKPCALIGQLKKVLKMTFPKSDFFWGRCQPSL